MRLAMHEWTMAAVSFDGKLQRNFINGVEAEQAVCKGAIAQTKLENSLRIGARGGQHCCGASRKACCHLDRLQLGLKRSLLLRRFYLVLFSSNLFKVLSNQFHQKVA